jgi:hypothetical protein
MKTEESVVIKVRDCGKMTPYDVSPLAEFLSDVISPSELVVNLQEFQSDIKRILTGILVASYDEEDPVLSDIPDMSFNAKGVFDNLYLLDIFIKAIDNCKPVQTEKAAAV